VRKHPFAIVGALWRFRLKGMPVLSGTAPELGHEGLPRPPQVRLALVPAARTSDTLIFVPTYNERATIEPLLEALLGLTSHCDVLIVDDSSTDGTIEALSARARSEPRLRVIVRSAKLGIGSAHKFGWTHAREHGYARIVTLDADLSHDPADVPRLLAALDAGADVAFGSRFAPGGRIEYRRWRLFLSRNGNSAARWLLRLPITEYTTSLRAAWLDRVPANLVEGISNEGYSFFLTCAVRLVRQGLRITEVPIHFRDRYSGVSKIARAEIFLCIINLVRLACERSGTKQRAQMNPYWWVVILCALFLLPAMFIRGAHYEEGTAIALARSIFEDGLWPEIYRYGERFVERPQALSWLLGAIGSLAGGMPVWLARIPTALSLLGGASLVCWLVRQYASAVAALFAAVCFIASPMMLQKTVTAEPDIVLSVVLFAAFVLFWRGYETGGPKASRWLVITAMLGFSGLMKGPQPLAYFFLGVGAFLLFRRQWKSFVVLGGVGVVTAAVVVVWYIIVYQHGDWATWIAHSRLSPVLPAEWAYWSVRFCFYVAIENLPGILLFSSLAWTVMHRGAWRDEDLVVALLFYTTACTLVLALWPGANGRYAMPATLAVAAGAGLAYDRFVVRQWLLVRGTIFVACLLVTYRLVINWIVMPLVPDKFRQQAILGHQVAAMLQSSDTLFVSKYAADYNLLAYVPYRVRVAPYDVISKAQPPFWAIMLSAELLTLQKAHAAGDIVQHLSGGPEASWQLLEVRR
jgi:4-amino-4-deoxy-L-arabinose transferase-like glycosyltransferase